MKNCLLYKCLFLFVCLFILRYNARMNVAACKTKSRSSWKQFCFLFLSLMVYFVSGFKFVLLTEGKKMQCEVFINFLQNQLF